KRIKFNYKILLLVAFFSFTASLAGARMVSILKAEILKPAILVILIIMAVYIYRKKNLGTKASNHISLTKQLIAGSIIGIVIGFYDGFFGPGTGSFLIVGFVVFMGFEFLTASAYAKVI